MIALHKRETEVFWLSKTAGGPIPSRAASFFSKMIHWNPARLFAANDAPLVGEGMAICRMDLFLSDTCRVPKVCMLQRRKTHARLWH